MSNDLNFPVLRDPLVPTYFDPVRILFLADEDINFTKEDKFGLTELIETLESTVGVFIHFSVTKAHRDQASANNTFPQDADIQGFRFDNPEHFNPKDYDQIWFFGIRRWDPSRNSTYNLSDQELRIVSQFMDAGGGVFATGDHEDLGASLCSRIPRVRSMRKWHFDQAAVTSSYEHYDPNSGDGPPVQGSFRHDTLVAGHDSIYTFDDQSDDVPASIVPTIYGLKNKYFSQCYPHPLLCGPNGTISVLPDHMHEGECIIPQDLKQETTFDGYVSAEYPSLDGFGAVPDVVACGVVTQHTTDNTSENANVDVQSKPREFGAIGAYDGHVVGVGRVVVESTFHHFVNINLIGAESNSSDPIKQKGFNASGSGQNHYAQIKAYYRNIGIWLCRPTIKSMMFDRTLWAARWDSQLRMLTPRLSDMRVAWNDALNYGFAVRATMARLAGNCMIMDWHFAQDNPLAHFSWWLKMKLPDPTPDEFRHSMMSPEELVTVAFAGIMSELVRATPTRETNFHDRLHENMRQIISIGLTRTFDRAMVEFNQRSAQTQRLLDRLRQGLR